MKTCMTLAECPAVQDSQSCAPQHGPCADRQFIALLDAYRGYGGLARMPELATRFRGPRAAGLARLTNSIICRQVICFEWHAQRWLPLFQFNRLEPTPRDELGQLFAELVCVYDAWALANWFVLPHPGLTGHTPVECLAADPPAVLRAAHADRLAAKG